MFSKLSVITILFSVLSWTNVNANAEAGTHPLQRLAQENKGEKFEQDRQAILAMTGKYRVTFDFTETVSFVEGYKLKDRALSQGDEIVNVIVDKETFISLQHILLVGGQQKIVVKHWRQDWIYEPKEIFEYIGANKWRRKELSSQERKGKWAQLVYQVDDSPRYAAVAEWVHELGLSSWTSPVSWRPLPRRDATKRDDYDVLAAVNRHVITPDGWVHEQDNTKLILRSEPRALVRESGVNTYKKFNELNSVIAESYWQVTKSYWAGVRAKWADITRTNGQFGLTVKGEPYQLYDPILDLAKEVHDGKLSPEKALSKAHGIIDRFVK